MGKRDSRELACGSQVGGGPGLGAKPQVVAERLALVSVSSEKQLLSPPPPPLLWDGGIFWLLPGQLLEEQESSIGCGWGRKGGQRSSMRVMVKGQ